MHEGGQPSTIAASMVQAHELPVVPVMVFGCGCSAAVHLFLEV